MTQKTRAPLPRPARPPRRWWSRLAASRSGSFAPEFAVVAVPAVLLLTGTIELGIASLNGVVLDGATREAARQIRTGQTQEAADPLESFRTRLCGELTGLFDCSGVLFDVRSFPTFSAVSVPPLYDENGDPIPPVFQPGEAGEIVVVRSTMRWAFQTPLLSHVVGDFKDVSSTIVFRNEPYKGPL
jgi:Flp pilus assembly protein TadG